MKDPLQERQVRFTCNPAVYLEDTPSGPRMHGRIYVAERPLVSGQLPVRVHVPFPQKERELSLGESRISRSNGYGMESKIPGGIPGILPLVRHRDDVFVEEVDPFMVPTQLPLGRRR